LVCDVAPVALDPDVVLVPAGGHVPPRSKMSYLSVPDHKLTLAGEASDATVPVSVFGPDIT